MLKAVSATGLALIQDCEGFRAEPTPIASGGWVVGYGHVRLEAPGAPMGRDEAAGVLARDLAPIVDMLNDRVTFPLSQSQFDALASFAFSIGAEAFLTSQVLRRVNAGDLIAAACAIDAWRVSAHEGEPPVPAAALLRRRALEVAQLFRDAPSAPSAVLLPRLDHAAAILGAPARTALGSDSADIGRRLTDILASEPETAALLIVQAIPENTEIDETELVTAYAEPAPRPVRGRAGRDPAAMALLSSGAGLLGASALLLLVGNADAALVLAAPGLIAAGAASYGLAAPAAA